jgi:hypothetical protein
MAAQRTEKRLYHTKNWEWESKDVYNWLRMLRLCNPCYKDIVIQDDFDTRAAIQALPEKFLHESSSISQVLNQRHGRRFPRLTYGAVLVALSRATSRAGIRIMPVHEINGLKYLTHLKHPKYLVIWRAGINPNGIWSAERSKAFCQANPHCLGKQKSKRKQFSSKSSKRSFFNARSTSQTRAEETWTAPRAKWINFIGGRILETAISIWRSG